MRRRNSGAISAGTWSDPTTQHLLIATGVVYLGLAVLHARGDTRYLRLWGEFFMTLVPLSLLVPTHVLFDEPPSLGTIGGAPVTLYEVACAGLCLALVAIGTRMRRPSVVAPGLASLAVVVLRVTDRHFEQTLGWPLALAAIGGAAMLGGVVSTWLRGRRS